MQYRLTQDEFVRLLLERDPMAEEFNPDRTVALVMRNPDLTVNLGPVGGVNYDAGEHFFYVRTLNPIPWL